MKKRMPAPRHVATTEGISGRGGSTMPTRPTTVSWVLAAITASSSGTEASSLPARMILRASSRHRCPREDHVDCMAMIESRTSSVSGTTWPAASMTKAARLSSTSGPPLASRILSFLDVECGSLAGRHDGAHQLARLGSVGAGLGTQAHELEHELVLGAEAELVLCIPQPVGVGDGTDEFGHLEHSRVGGVTVHLPLVDGKRHGGCVEHGCVAYGSYKLELLEGVADGCARGDVIACIGGGAFEAEHAHRGGSHAVRGERARLVGAEDGYGSERLARGELLAQDLGVGHLLGDDGERECDCDGQTFGDEGDQDGYDVDEERRHGHELGMLGSQVGRPDNDADHGERHGNRSDGCHKEAHLSLERCRTRLGPVGHGSDSAKDGVVARGHDDTDGRAGNTAGAGQRNVARLEAMSLRSAAILLPSDTTTISPWDKVVCLDAGMCAVADGGDCVGEHAYDGIHDAARAKILPRVEDGLDDDDDEQHHGKRKIGCLRVGFAKRLPGDKGKDGADDE
ncbi:hypothetical protein L1887_44552 [Cichorium endivia]|nr:hypothetical protein L1887_44552 [Cichorium endivia]